MKTLALLEITSSDYFKGYHRTVLSIPVRNKIDHSELANDLNYEFDCLYECMKDTHSQTELLIIEKCINDIKNKGSELYFDSTDISTDFTDTYFYFGLINPVYNNGIMFCE